MDTLSLLWECPICGKEIEVQRATNHRWEDWSLVDEHKRFHERYGLVLD